MKILQNAIVLYAIVSTSSGTFSEDEDDRNDVALAKQLCPDDQVKLVDNCFATYVSFYGFSLVNGTYLPPRGSGIFEDAFVNRNTTCSNYQFLRNCMNQLPPGCTTFQTLNLLTQNSRDTFFYIRELSLVELYCDYHTQFIDYTYCQNLIDARKFQESIYQSCSMYEQDNCGSVVRTEQCQKGVIIKICDKKRSLTSFCTYQQIQHRMTGWIVCSNLPCSTYRPHVLILLVVMIIRCIY